MTAHDCPQCGKPLFRDAPQGLCPACLLKAALPGQSALESAGTGLNDSSSAPTIAPEAGTSLRYFGDYELLQEIARGGMGVIWKARQKSLNRDVAVKMIRAGALASPEEVQRFLREAEAAANLQHPNIVAIHEVGEHGGQHYFSMDYVKGRDLGALVKDGPLAPQRAAAYVKIIAEAIHFAHQRGTLHRDLKPQNVLIDEADQPRITDFGLAKIMKDDSRLTQTGVIMGSPSYMPPEQAAGRIGEVGPASDVYSLGAILYELLTGRPPFRASSPVATIMAVIETEPAEPRQLKTDIPVDLETICLKCLEKSPSSRYPTARALAEELDRYLKGEPILARPASTVRKLVSWGRRHPGVLAAVAALLAVAISFGAYYLYEENAFLRAQKDDPQLALLVYPHQRKVGAVLRPDQIMAESGPRGDSLAMWGNISGMALAAGIYLWIFLLVRSRGNSFKAWFDPAKAGRPPTRPLGERTWTIALVVGLAMVGCGVVLLVKAIQAQVWEGESIWSAVVSMYALSYFAIVIFGFLVRDYRLVHYGSASRQLTEEQIEPIRRAMEDYDAPAAIKLYREAVPDAGLVEASQYVTQLADSLKEQFPGKFIRPPLKFNWMALSICAAIEAVLLVVFCLTMPTLRTFPRSADDTPSSPAVFLLQFGVTVLLGAALIGLAGIVGQRASRREKTLIPRLLLALVSMLMVGVFVFTSIKPSQNWPYMCGILFGIALMACAFKRQYGRK